MANPLVVEIPKGEVVPIAINVTRGWLRNLKRYTPILATTRITGQLAPSEEEILEEGNVLFALDGVNEEIKNDVAIDIYVISPNIDAKLRVDLP